MFETESEIEQSLENARIVQQGLLPKRRHFERLFTDHFILYKPKEILSGDFFWIGQRHELRYIVVGDCTGHGISASLVSVLALNLLEYVIMNKGLKKVNKILSEVDLKFIESFKSSNESQFDNPWIDLSIVAIDDDKKKLFFASANRKLLHVKKDGYSQTYRAEGYPIGGWKVKEQHSFAVTTIDFESGEKIYLGSDGLQHQFGGPFDKKFGSKNLHNFISQNSNLKMDEQCERLNIALLNWQGEHLQTDDICVVGVEL
jgi:serine phosphatase RsbU (regulator of sigma subunit)